MADENSGDNMAKLLGRRKAFKSKLTRIERTVLALNDETSCAYLEVQLEFVEKIEADILTFEDDMLAAVPADQYDVQAAECGQLIERCLLLKATLKALIDPTLRTTFPDAGVPAQWMQQEVSYVKKEKYSNDMSSYLVNTSQRCPMCIREQLPFKCNRRLKSRSAERQELKQTSALCFNCLCPGHSARHCDAAGCTRCGKKHNTLFHVQENAAMKINPTNWNNVCKSTKTRSVLLPTALVQVPDNDGQLTTVRALIDGESQASFIKESCVKRLGLHREAGSMVITGVGKGATAVTTTKVTLTIKSHFDINFAIRVEAFILSKVTDYQPLVPDNYDWNYLQGLLRADPQFYAAGDIELLWGADVKSLIDSAGAAQGPMGKLTGELTAFGWIISGVVDFETPALSCQNVTPLS